jgi:hypothetical protein
MKLRELIVADVSAVWKQWSTYVLTALVAFPSAYDAIAAMGWMDQLPEPARWSIRGLATAGILAKHYRQGWWKQDKTNV